MQYKLFSSWRPFSCVFITGSNSSWVDITVILLKITLLRNRHGSSCQYCHKVLWGSAKTSMKYSWWASCQPVIGSLFQMLSEDSRNMLLCVEAARFLTSILPDTLGYSTDILFHLKISHSRKMDSVMFSWVFSCVTKSFSNFTVSSCTSEGLHWMLGRTSSQSEWSSLGTCCSRKWWSSHS